MLVGCDAFERVLTEQLAHQAEQGRGEAKNDPERLIGWTTRSVFVALVLAGAICFVGGAICGRPLRLSKPGARGDPRGGPATLSQRKQLGN